MSNKAIINEDVCKGCGLCVSICPRLVLENDLVRLNAKGYHPATFAHPEKCTACSMCAIVCPDSAIRVEKE